MTTRQQLTLAQLAAVFAVSSVSIYLWRQGTPTKTALMAPYTPARVRRWAKVNSVPIIINPDNLVAMSSVTRALSRATVARGKKPGLKRNAAGKLSGINPGRAGSFGRAAALVNSKRAARARAA